MLYNPEKLLIIAGPCALESRELAFDVAKYLLEIQETYPEVQLVFKSSFDKANRSSVNSKRGVGFNFGAEIFRELKASTNLLLTTDIHLQEQAKWAAEVCDILQIPAFLCRQTDLLYAAAVTGRVVSVKKGQFLSPDEMKFVIEKLRNFGAQEIWPMERGTTFGYHNLVVDMRSFSIMRQFSNIAIFDATHSVQLPGGQNGVTVGQRQFVEHLAYGALAAGANGLFFEVHTNPDKAICDATNQLDVRQLSKIVGHCVKFWKLRKEIEN